MEEVGPGAGAAGGKDNSRVEPHKQDPGRNGSEEQDWSRD